MLKTLYCLLVLSAIACSSQTTIGGTAANPRIANAVDLGRVPPGTEFDFVLGLQIRNEAGLHKFLANQSLTRDELTPIDFGDAFGVSAARYAYLVSWVRVHGMEVVRTNVGRTSITVHATAEAIERAFGTQMHDFEDSAGRFTASLSNLTFDPDVAPVVSGTVGLSGERPWLSHRVTQPRPLPNAGGTPCSLANGQGNVSMGALDLQALYGYAGAAVTSPGMGETVVILGAGPGPDPAVDVQPYVDAYGLGTNVGVQYKPIHLGGPSRETGMAATGEQGENTLDVDMVLALAPFATVAHVLTATNNPGLLTDGVSYIVNDSTLSKAHSVTLSYGSCERGSAGGMPVLNALFAQAEAQGQQWFSASGDTATDGCRDGAGNKIISATWPASSPNVVSVGGTGLATPQTSVTVDTAEATWSSGGGGVSESFDKPAFQTGIGPGAGDSSRDVPDVAAIADPATGVCVAQGGPPTGGVGGTSAAAPMWAAVWAVVHQAVHASKGETAFSTGLLTIYAIGKNIPAATTRANQPLKDVSAGAIKGPGGGINGYPAGAGYDLATGWGTPNLAKLIAVWQ